MVVVTSKAFDSTACTWCLVYVRLYDYYRIVIDMHVVPNIRDGGQKPEVVMI